MIRIPIAKPSLDQADRLSVLDPLDSGWLVQGPRVAQFERAVAEYVGTPHAIATTSCTAALHLALLALGIGPGDEVILPSFTFVATANAIECTGARPIFVDIDLPTFNLSPADAEAAVTERTRAIIPVHLFGACSRYGRDPHARGSTWLEGDRGCGVCDRYDRSRTTCWDAGHDWVLQLPSAQGHHDR